MLPESAHGSLPSRSPAFYFGFAGLLLLMAIVGLDSRRSLLAVEANNSALRTESRRRDALLDQLRLEIYRAGTVVRDHLVEPDTDRAANHKAELAALRIQVANAMSAYGTAVLPGERNTFQKLQDDVAAYWQSLDPLLRWDAAARRANGTEYLNSVVLPRRSEAVELIRQITQLNDRDLDAGEDRIRQAEAGLRRRITFVSIASVLLGLVLAVFSIRRTQRLELEAERRYREVAAARRELSRLSDQLVKAQEEERRRLSRELHDEIGQSMSAMLMEIRRLQASAPTSESQRQRLAVVRNIAESTVGTVRNMALLLRPSMLDDLGLVPALRWQAKEVSRRTGMTVSVRAEDLNEELPDSVRTCLYRIAQEALHNCVRHSQADTVQVIVERREDSLMLAVRDNGVGFDASTEKGLGLLGMQERAEALGGKLIVESQAGKGTVVETRFKLRSVGLEHEAAIGAR